MPTEPATGGRGSWWNCRVRAPGEPERVHVVASGRYPDGMTVDLAPEMARVQMGAAAVGCAVLQDERVVALEVAHSFAPTLRTLPPVFFVEVRDSTARPPVVALVAFAGHGQPAGRLLDAVDAEGLGIGGDDQVGTVRWLPSTGQALELYVQPAWRRRSIAAALLAAAELLSVARSWPRLWGDGNRTELGEQARNARSWADRTADLTTLAPPMTPGS